MRVFNKNKRFKLKYDREKKIKNIKNFKNIDDSNKNLTEILDGEVVMEKEIIEQRIKTWKFLNFSEFKLWSVLINLWKDIEFYFRFTKYQDLFDKNEKGFIPKAPEEKFDIDSENAFLYDADNLAAFIESSEEAENDPDYEEIDDFNEPDDFVQIDEEHIDIIYF